MGTISYEDATGSCADFEGKNWGPFEIVPSEDTKDYEESLDVGPLMRRLFEKQIYTDVTFTSTSWNSSISAHKAVMATKSSYFKELLFNEKSKESDVMPRNVKISNISFRAFQCIVKYIYTNEISLEDDGFALEIHEVAKIFNIQPLIQRCILHIQSIELTEKNLDTLFCLSEAKKNVDLEERCKAYVEENARRVISSEEFKAYTYSTVQRICELPCLNINSEIDFLDALMRWIKVQLPDRRQTLTSSLLKYIRFLSLTPEEFTRVIRKYPNLLTAADGLELLMYLIDPETTVVLPEWCNKSEQERESVELMRSDVCFYLQPDTEQQVDTTELISWLQMKCISGVHKINAMTFLFSDLVEDRNIVTITLNVCVLPHKFTLRENISVCEKETKLIFPHPILMKPNQLVQIEAKARGIQKCKFLCLKDDDNTYKDNAYEDNHFICQEYSSSPYFRLFFISKVECESRIMYTDFRRRPRRNYSSRRRPRRSRY